MSWPVEIYADKASGKSLFLFTRVETRPWINEALSPENSMPKKGEGENVLSSLPRITGPANNTEYGNY